MFYPPKPRAQGGKTGRGRVLVCSNLHWLCDPSHWMGGHFTEDSPQATLCLNFVAGAIGARAGAVWSSAPRESLA